MRDIDRAEQRERAGGRKHTGDHRILEGIADNRLRAATQEFTAGNQQQYIDRYNRMRDALKATGRPIVYSLCEWGDYTPWTWGAQTGHLWRTTGDISDNWASMLSILGQNAPLDQYAGPGHWNDPDMLEVGNGGMTDTEYRSHFSLWAVMAAPLLAGSDLRNPSQATLDILTNKDVIAVDQDSLGKQGKLITNAGGLWVFSKPLANGDYAIALFNSNSSAQSISTTAAAAGIPSAPGYALHDLWSKATTSSSGTIGATVAPHATVMYRVVADPNWADYPPSTSIGASITTSAGPSAATGQYQIAGHAFTVKGSVSNYGGKDAPGATLKLTGPSAYDGLSYEAEAASSTRNGAVTLASCGGCSGGSKVGYIGNGANNWVRLNGINAASAGTYAVTVFANVSGTRSLFMSVNGGAGQELKFTGGSYDSPTPITVNVPLNAGANTLRFYNDTAYGPDLDGVVVGGTDAPSGWTISPSDAVTTPTLGAGKTLEVNWTVTPPANAQPGTYHLQVEGNIGDQQLSSPITVTLAGPPIQTGYLSDQQWLESSNYWGPVERDKSNGEQAAGDGKAITIGGKAYTKGLGVHAASSVLFYNAAHCATLTAAVGVDDESTAGGKVEFQVWADDRMIASSGPVTYQDAAKPLTANIGNSQFIRLVVTNSDDGPNYDHADWADLQVTCGGSTSSEGGAGGTVPATLSLTLGAPATFGAFQAGVDRTYEASTTANVISTAGDATLTVDGGTLTNGAFRLAEPLQIALSKSSWSAPVSNDAVTIGLKQHIGANDPLRTGNYSKTLTFTLSTTTP